MRKYVLLASVLLTGCATSPQDCDLQAQDPSFLTKLSCTTSGGYRQKVSEEEQKVQLSQWENQRAKQDLANTQNRQQGTDQAQAKAGQGKRGTGLPDHAQERRQVAHRPEALAQAGFLRGVSASGGGSRHARIVRA